MRHLDSKRLSATQPPLNADAPLRRPESHVARGTLLLLCVGLDGGIDSGRIGARLLVHLNPLLELTDVMLPTDSIWLQVGFDRRVDGGVELEALVAVHLPRGHAALCSPPLGCGGGGVGRTFLISSTPARRLPTTYDVSLISLPSAAGARRCTGSAETTCARACLAEERAVSMVKVRVPSRPCISGSRHGGRAWRTHVFACSLNLVRSGASCPCLTCISCGSSSR
mmetsp:Transcript_37552/g.65995  ORF Transcript_37552/g.65995 Transcript_37552/m.65995 type:complete len:225 (-) Transcript_37552:101-775(-)